MKFEQPQRHREDQSVKRANRPVDQGYSGNYGYNFPHIEVAEELKENTAETLDDIDLALGALAVEAA
jgi:hypothetical protein